MEVIFLIDPTIAVLLNVKPSLPLPDGCSCYPVRLTYLFALPLIASIVR